MKRRFNWQLWSGLLLAVVAFLTYFMVFSQFAVTRDVPWASMLLFAIALALLAAGWLRAPKKVLASIVAFLGIAIFGLFSYSVFIGSKNLPASANAPAVGTKAPDFALRDANGRTVTLEQLRAGSNGVLLIFYRGHW
jgi:hypothetical protein